MEFKVWHEIHIAGQPDLFLGTTREQHVTVDGVEKAQSAIQRKLMQEFDKMRNAATILKADGSGLLVISLLNQPVYFVPRFVFVC